MARRQGQAPQCAPYLVTAIASISTMKSGCARRCTSTVVLVGSTRSTPPDVHASEELVNVRHVRGGLHQVIQGGTGGRQGRLEVLADLADLGAHVAFADHITVTVTVSWPAIKMVRRPSTTTTWERPPGPVRRAWRGLRAGYFGVACMSPLLGDPIDRPPSGLIAHGPHHTLTAVARKRC